MSRKGHPSEAIFKEYPVCTESLTIDDLLPVRQALVQVLDRIVQIGEALRLPHVRVSEISRMHRTNADRRAIAIIDTWLRGNYMKNKRPYILNPGKEHASWWNLVWAVADNAGGQSPAFAQEIAKRLQSAELDNVFGPKHDFLKNVDTKQFVPDDVQDISKELQELRAKWYEMGVALKVPTATLDQIQQQTSGMSDESFKEMISRWIQDNIDGENVPCWKILLEAVAAEYGGQNVALASNLAPEHQAPVANGKANGKPVKSKQKPPKQRLAADEAQKDQTSDLRKNLESLHFDASSEPESASGHISSDGKWSLPGSKNRSRSRSRSPNPPTHTQPLLPADKFIVYQRNPHTLESEEQPHGLAVIISNEEFDGLGQRQCCPWDNFNVETAFKKLGYRVVIRHNQSGTQMSQIFDSIRRNDPGELHISGNDDSFVCLVSSHGDWDKQKNTDLIYGRDGNPFQNKGKFYLKQEAYEKLNAKECPHLRGRPKLFFVQACRGGKRGEIVSDSGSAMSGMGIKKARRLPIESDFFFSYSTAEETKSYRYDPNATHAEGPGETKYDDTDNGLVVGSFYITELCEALKKYSHRLDLVHIVLSVHQVLQATDKNLFQLSDDVVTRQCPHLLTSLRGPVFFFDEAEKNFQEYLGK